MLRTGIMLTLVRALVSALSLARNLLIARLISVDDYGVAATFGLIISIVEMASSFGLKQQIVQARDGDDARFQAALQGFQVMRGALSTCILLAVAGPFAAFFDVPDAAMAYRIMALVPLLNSLVHFDINRRMRKMVFWPSLLTSALAVIVAFLAVWPLYRWFGDWRVMLGSLILQTLVTLVVSHLVSERPYRIVFDRVLIVRSLGFGWPIMINTFLMYIGLQGDRMIVGRELGMAALAIYSMGVTLTLTPTLVLAGSIFSFFLPQLSAAQDDRGRFIHLSNIAMQLILVMAGLIVAGIAILGGPLVHLLLGERYHPVLPLLNWFAILFAVRMLKYGPSLIALAVAETRNAMYANIARALAMPAFWYVAATSGDLVLLLWIATLGEMLSHGLALAQLRWRRIISLRRMILPHIVIFGFFGLVIGLSAGLPPSQPQSLPSLLVIVVLVVASAGLLRAMPELWGYTLRRLAGVLGRS